MLSIPLFLLLQLLLLPRISPILVADQFSSTVVVLQDDAISPQFLQFNIWAPARWWLQDYGTSGRLLAVIESISEEAEGNNGTNSWQLVLQLLISAPDQRVPYTRAIRINDTRGTVPSVERMPECDADEEEAKDDADAEAQKRMELELELSANAVLARGKNAVRYALPHRLNASSSSSDLRVYFAHQRMQNGTAMAFCQLRSEMDTRETSKFSLPSTRSYTAPASASPMSTSIPASHSASPTSSEAPALPTLLPTLAVSSNHSRPPQWPYKRRRIKAPRRSMLAAQRALMPAHYAPASASMRPFVRPWIPAPPPASASPASSTPPSYIDIIRDRHLYEEVQRSRTNELNSRWSPAFFAFGLLVGTMITLTGAFALCTSVALQWRPKMQAPQAQKCPNPNIPKAGRNKAAAFSPYGPRQSTTSTII